MGYAQITVEREGPIEVLTLNNPRKINAPSQTMIGEMAQALNNLAEGAQLGIRAFIEKTSPEWKHR